MCVCEVERMSWSEDYSYQYEYMPAAVDVETSPTDEAAAAAAGDEFVYPGARELAVFHDWYKCYHGYLATRNTTAT